MSTTIRKALYSPSAAHRLPVRLVAAAAIFALALSAPAGGIAAADDAFRLFEEGKESLHAGRNDDAVRAFSAALRLFDQSDRNAQVVRLARAQAYYRNGDVDPALKDVSAVLGSAGLDGENRASALQLRGIINTGRNREEQALHDFTEAIKTRHGDIQLRASSFANRGMTFVALGRVDEAVSDFNKAIELNPDYAFAYAGRGHAYLRQDNLPAARRDTEKALSFNPDAETAKIAEKVLKSISVNFTGPDRISVPLSDNGHVFVQVRFGNGGAPRRFMLDTGATYTLISRELLESISGETQVRRIGTARVMIADGSLHEVLRYSVKDVYLFNIPLGEIEVLVFPTRRKLGPNLFGARSFKQIVISIDGSAGKAEIRRTDTDQSQRR